MCQSLLKAVDVAFKAFFIFVLNYPAQSIATWEFFENVVYCIEKEGGEKHPSQTVKIMQSLFAFKKD